MNKIIRCTNIELGSMKIVELVYDIVKDSSSYVYVIDEKENLYNMLYRSSCKYIKLIANTKDDYYIKSVIRYFISICNKRTEELKSNKYSEYLGLTLIINQQALTKETKNLLYYLEKNSERANITVLHTEVNTPFRTSNDILAFRERSIMEVSEKDFEKLSCVTYENNVTEKYSDRYTPNEVDYSHMNNLRSKYQKAGRCIIFLGKRCTYSMDSSDTNVIFYSNCVSKLCIFSDSQIILTEYRRILDMNIKNSYRVSIKIINIRNDESVWKLQDNNDLDNINHILLVDTRVINESNMEYLQEMYRNKILAFKDNSSVHSYKGDSRRNELHLVDKVEIFKRYNIKNENEKGLSQLVIEKGF